MPRLINQPRKFRNSPRGIDWNKLVDGRQYQFIEGQDFQGDPTSVQSSAHQAANRRGMKARTMTDGNDVIVQFYKPTK